MTTCKRRYNKSVSSTISDRAAVALGLPMRDNAGQPNTVAHRLWSLSCDKGRTMFKAFVRQERTMQVGYARTSTTVQEAGLEAQLRDLAAAGCAKLFQEQVSSVSERHALAKCLAFLREEDVLYVTKPDRLARSTSELLAIEGDLSKRGVGLVVLSMGGAALDTRNPTSKLMLTILAAVAAWEREIMLERQREGIAKAKEEGRYKGRAPTARRHSDTVRSLHCQGMSPTAIAQQVGINRASVYRILSAVTA